MKTARQYGRDRQFKETIRSMFKYKLRMMAREGQKQDIKKVFENFPDLFTSRFKAEIYFRAYFPGGPVILKYFDRIRSKCKRT